MKRRNFLENISVAAVSLPFTPVFFAFSEESLDDSYFSVFNEREKRYFFLHIEQNKIQYLNDGDLLSNIKDQPFFYQTKDKIFYLKNSGLTLIYRYNKETEELDYFFF